jgi:hypothetical protein
MHQCHALRTVWFDRDVLNKSSKRTSGRANSENEIETRSIGEVSATVSGIFSFQVIIHAPITPHGEVFCYPNFTVKSIMHL